MNAPAAARSPTGPDALTRPIRVSVSILLAFGLFMQVLLTLSASMADRAVDRGVAPMHELLLVQRYAEQAIQLVKQDDTLRQTACGDRLEPALCEVPQLLLNVAAAAQRLLDGEGGLAGLPRSHPLEGQARSIATELRDTASRLHALHGAHTPRTPRTPQQLLTLQRGLLDINSGAQRLEQLVLAQLQEDFNTKRWMDLLAIGVTGLLMAVAVVTLFWMWSHVREAFTRLHNSEARLRAYTNAVPDPAYVLNREGQVLDILGFNGIRPGTPDPVPVGECIQDHQPAHVAQQYLQGIAQALDRRAVLTVESELQAADGQPHWYEARVAPMDATAEAARNGHTVPSQVIWLARDITSRKASEQALRQLNDQLEQRVAERTRELHDAAEELRRFNYTVSHDLRAPLRAVEAYTALAVEEAGDTLSPSARGLLERSRKSAHQLAHMVESLLNLSRIGEMPLQHSWLDLSAMATDICMAFALDQKDHHIDWRVTPGLTAWADEHLIRSVLQNLINNAVKYSAHKEPAHLEIGSQDQVDGQTAFYVRDNGAGFDMAHAAQLFQPFTRLHSAREFPGDGIGLATVRRIVARHGGRIWAQGQVDAGATIFFTLPPPPREREFTSSRPSPLWPDIEP